MYIILTMNSNFHNFQCNFHLLINISMTVITNYTMHFHYISKQLINLFIYLLWSFGVSGVGLDPCGSFPIWIFYDSMTYRAVLTLPFCTHSSERLRLSQKNGRSTSMLFHLWHLGKLNQLVLLTPHILCRLPWNYDKFTEIG